MDSEQILTLRFCCTQNRKNNNSNGSTSFKDCEIPRNHTYYICCHKCHEPLHLAIQPLPCLLFFQHFPKTISFRKTSNTQTQLDNHLSRGTEFAGRERNPVGTSGEGLIKALDLMNLGLYFTLFVFVDKRKVFSPNVHCEQSSFLHK